MKKIAIFSLLALSLNFALADDNNVKSSPLSDYFKPVAQGDVIGSNNFSLGIDASLVGVGRGGNASAPFLYGAQNIDGQYISIPSYALDGKSVSQMNGLLNINARYGILDYFEIYANANGYYQSSYYYSDDNGSIPDKMNFAGANIGLLVTLYKGDHTRIVIGDNSDIVSNSVFNNSVSNLDFFKGHTFMINLIRQRAEGDKFAAFTLQGYYRLNLNQSYKDFNYKIGDEAGAKFLWQFGKGRNLGFIEGNLAFRDSDTINGVKVGNPYNGIGTGFGFGWKGDTSKHLGYKVGFNYMSYALNYNAASYGLTFGVYFK